MMTDIISVLRKGSQAQQLHAHIEGQKIFVADDEDVCRGDVIRSDRFVEPHIVLESRVDRDSGGNSLAYRTLTVQPISRWDEDRKAEESRVPQQLIQHIHHAQSVAGRDVVSPITTINIVQCLSALAQAVQESPNVPENEKPGLVSKIRDLANNPYVSGVGSTAIFEAIRGFLGQM